MFRIGLISDTHGLLRPEAQAFLQGCDHIIHAGDIGSPAILDDLGRIAAVTAVRGNNDRGPWADPLPETAVLRLGEAAICVVHDLTDLIVDPAAEGFQAVVSGHSHQPALAERGGVLYVNPGSAGRRRFRLPVAVGELFVHERKVTARLLELTV